MLAKMKAPEGCTSCSAGGQTYEVVDGEITVPVEHAAALMFHGFILSEFEPTDEDISAQEAKAIADAEEAESNRQKAEAEAEAKKLLDEEKAPAILEAEAAVEKAKDDIFKEKDVDQKATLAAILTEKQAALDALRNV